MEGLNSKNKNIKGGGSPQQMNGNIPNSHDKTCNPNGKSCKVNAKI